MSEVNLTGEAEDVAKNTRVPAADDHSLTPKNMAFSSTTVASGNAKGSDWCPRACASLSL